MVVTLGNGKEVIYGPSSRPASINRLWTELSSRVHKDSQLDVGNRQAPPEVLFSGRTPRRAAPLART